MVRILSTYRWVNHPLSPLMLHQIAAAGIPKVEIFCASSHFRYDDPQQVRELSGALSEYRLSLHSLHAPTERGSGQSISISDPERIRRQDAVDEIKRALEVAERIPFSFLVQHIGSSRQPADGRTTDAAFSSLEHLAVFAKQRGVTIAVENTPSEIGAAEAIVKFVKETHLHDLRFCFDIGHANIGEGVAQSWELMRDRAVTCHVHDNHGDKDEHLPPYDGEIDWDAAFEGFGAAAQPPFLVMELKEQGIENPALDKIRGVFDRMEEHLDKKGVSSPST